jgi:hypothetical protein
LQHNDDIKDLLDPDSPDKAVTLREDAAGSVLVSGLCEVPVSSAAAMMTALRQGFKHRATVCAVALLCLSSAVAAPPCSIAPL